MGNIFSNFFRLGRSAAPFLSQDWASDCHFIKALLQEPLSLTPPPPVVRGLERPPPPPPRKKNLFPISPIEKSTPLELGNFDN